MEIGLAVITMSITGLACAAILVVADKFFAVQENPKVEEVAALLPGINCGGCGFAGCSDYAKAIVLHGASITLCGPGGNETAKGIANILGVETAEKQRMVALVHCAGDSSKSTRKSYYNGIADCYAAHSLGGDKLCRYGCLGYGTCARVCPVNAIEITDKRIAVVHSEICIGCGNCLRACPRSLIKMVPADRPLHVICSSKDKGPIVKKACSVGCIGCSLCTKLVKNEAIRMDGALAVVDYTKDPVDTIAAEKCPGHCIINKKF